MFDNFYLSQKGCTIFPVQAKVVMGWGISGVCWIPTEKIALIAHFR